MTLDEVREIVSKLTYKPQTTFAVRKSFVDAGYYMIVVQVYCDDVDHPWLKNYARSEVLFHEKDLVEWTVELLIARIENAIHSIEDHEIKEWLRLDGKFLSDPHPEIPHGKNWRTKEAFDGLGPVRDVALDGTRTTGNAQRKGGKAPPTPNRDRAGGTHPDHGGKRPRRDR